MVRFNGNLQAKEAMLESHYYPARKGFAGFSRDGGLAEWNPGNRNHREHEGKGKRKHTVVKGPVGECRIFFIVAFYGIPLCFGYFF